MFWLTFVGILLLILSFLSPFFGLINYMAVLYLRPMQFYPQLVPYHIARVFAVAIIFGFILRYGRKKKIFLNNIQDKILVILLFVIVLSFAVGWIPRCLQELEQMAKNVVVYALILGMVNSEKRLKILIWSLLIMSGILGFNTIQEYRTLDPAALHTVRLGGFSGGYFGGAGDFAVMMNVVIPYAFFITVGAGPILFRPLGLLLLVILIWAMVATHARGGVIAFAAVALGLAYFGVRTRRFFKKILSISLVVAAVAGIIIFAPSAFKERASTITDYQRQTTATMRIDYWILGIKMFLSNPLIGVGAGNYQRRYHDFGGWENEWKVPHNMYIDALSGLGILGFGCLFFLLYFTFKDGLFTYRLLRKNNKTNTFLYTANQGAVVSLFAYCVGGMFQSIFTYPILYIIIAIIVAIKNTALLQINANKL